jgi:Tol biopolymer transport system component
MAVDERLRRALEQAGRPADPSGIYEHLIRRRERRRIARRVQSGVIAVAVVAGSIAGFYGLSRVFDPGERTPGAGPSPVPIDHANGLIAYVTNWELHAMRPDGSGDRLIPSPGPVRAVSWSPDGTRLAVVTTDRGELGGQRLWVMDNDGSDAMDLATAQIMVSPSWAPDGMTLAYAALVEDRAEIHLIGADGTDDRVIHAEPGLGLFPIHGVRISPDGRTMLVDRRSESDAEILAMNVDGTDIRPLTSSEIGLAPSWSPDGLWIAFVRVALSDPDDPSSATRDVFVMNADGSGVRRLTEGERVGIDDGPVWAPDGTKIAYLTGLDPTTLVVMNPDGSDPVELPAIDVGQFSWQPLPLEPPPTPSPTAEPSPSPSSHPSQDIGLGFPICNASSIDGAFAVPGEMSTVFVATRRGDVGGCPDPDNAFNVIALDIDRDGLADASYGPIVCEFECRTFSAPDLDADGTAELLIVQTGGTVHGLGLYEVEASDGGTVILPVTVAPPGDPEGGFEPGAEVRLLLGGDEFFLYTLRCGDPQMRNGPGLIVTAAESLPHDSPDANWHAHVSTFALVDGSLRVMDVGDFTEPVGSGAPSFQSGETLCGSNLGP